MGGEDEAGGVEAGAREHVVRVWVADFVARVVGWGEEFEFGEGDGLGGGADGAGGRVGQEGRG